MKKAILTIVLFLIVLFTSSCESQVIAQKNQTSSQVSPMNAEPAPNSEDIKGQLPPVNNEPLPDFSVPANPNADIGEQVAAEIALKQ